MKQNNPKRNSFNQKENTFVVLYYTLFVSFILGIGYFVIYTLFSIFHFTSYRIVIFFLIAIFLSNIFAKLTKIIIKENEKTISF